MAKLKGKHCDQQDFMALIRAIAAGESSKVRKLIESHPSLVTQQAVVGASRHEAKNYFFESLGHYLNTGDTALHMAAAAYDVDLVRKLIGRGADVAAQNRRGAQPLHYAADGRNGMKPVAARAQAATIAFLIKAGAAANAFNKDGVAPLHRAVRTRSAAAVKALLDNGADVRLKNKSGSTPLDLASMTTGRGGSGTPWAKEQQRQIIEMLGKYGARRPRP